MENEKSVDVANSESHELGTKGVSYLFFKYGFLTLLGMGAQAVMVILEGLFIGNGLGALGLATVSVVMPLELLNDALGGALGIGVSTVSALKKGEGKIKQAQKAFSDGFWATVILSIALALLIGLNASSVATLLGAQSATHAAATTFIRIFMIGYPFAITGQVVVSMLRVDEQPGIGTIVMSLAAILAATELYYGIFIAKWGIVAVGIYYGMSIGLFFTGIFYFLFAKTKFKIRFDFKFDWGMLKNSVSISMPFFLVTMSSFVFTWVMNVMLGRFGNSIDVAAFGIVNGYIFYILNMVTVSFTTGMQPIVSYNFGAKLQDRVRGLLNVGMITNIVVIAGITLLFAIFAHPIIAFFAGGNAMLTKVTISAAVTMVCLTALGSTSNVLSGYYQAINKVKISVFLGITKFLILGTPLLIILVLTLGVKGAWVSQPAADIFAFVIAVFIWRKELKHISE